jgi:hypothetical protein
LVVVLDTMIKAQANPHKTAAVYVAMAAAKSAVEGRVLSDRDFAEAAELCRVLKQEALTVEELRAVERLARKGHAKSLG